MKENAKRISIDVLVDIIGGILLTIATYSFAVPADFPMTGVSGVALIFYQAFGLPVGALTVILNIPIIICCYKTLGKQFGTAAAAVSGRSDSGSYLHRCPAGNRLRNYLYEGIIHRRI